MSYHKTTILLQAKNSFVEIAGFCGSLVDLDQIEASIREMEAFLASQVPKQKDRNSWQKGTLIIPDDAQLKKTSSRDRELWTRHMVSGGSQPPPGFETKGGFRQEHKLLYEAKTLYGQMSRHMAIAQYMAERQQPFLQSGNWMDKKKLTILELAECLPEWSEKTVRDSVHSLSFAFAGNTFPADTLVCASEMPSICKQLVEVQRKLPNAGAPLLTNMLNAQGIQVSRRMVGKALQLLAHHTSRQLAH